MRIAPDQVVVLAVVAVAAAWLARRVVRQLRAARDPAAGCASDCGCASAPPREGRQP